MDRVEAGTSSTTYQSASGMMDSSQKEDANRSGAGWMNPRNAGVRLGMTVLVVCAVVATLQVSMYRSAPTGASTTALEREQAVAIDTASESSEPTTGTLSVRVSNVYTEKYGAIGEQLSWHDLSIIDVHKPATLTAWDTSTLISDDVTYRWTLTHTKNAHSTSVLTGASVDFSFDTLGDWTVALEKFEGGLVTDSVSTGVTAKYVRREIRMLTDEDRENFFAAMEVVYNTETQAGQKLYGDAFLEADWFASLHNNFAGDRACDHFHDGLGFLSWHSALTNRFEKSLQSVDKSVVLPYWDFTIDGQQATESARDGMDAEQASIESFVQSPIFSDNWFGQIFPESHVLTGRFAGLKVPEVGTVYGIENTVESPYGLVRAPWNMNANPLVSRFTGVNGYYPFTAVDCSVHYDLMNYTSYSDIGMAMQYDPHGLIHIQVGGSGNADFYTAAVNDLHMDSSQVGSFVKESFAWIKNMWRSEYLDCDTGCEIGDADNCNCSCNSTADGLYAIFGTDETRWTDVDGDDISSSLIDMMCNRYTGSTSTGGQPYLGDLLESASPADPLFWPIHPTMERLFQRWVMNDGLDMSWPDANSITVKAGRELECDGHRATDAMDVDGLFVDPDESYSVLDYATKTMMKNADDMDYVYHNYVWTHCAAAGYPEDFAFKT